VGAATAQGGDGAAATFISRPIALLPALLCRRAAGPARAVLHEMAHVWQHQSGINLLLRRHPFCRYSYKLRKDAPLSAYNIEQQAEIIRHIFLLRRGADVPGAPPLADLEALLPF
jgi:hypothetical protein